MSKQTWGWLGSSMGALFLLVFIVAGLLTIAEAVSWCYQNYGTLGVIIPPSLIGMSLCGMEELR
jgi:hypothetical protein